MLVCSTIVIGLVIAGVMMPNVGWPIVLVAIVDGRRASLIGASNLETAQATRAVGVSDIGGARAGARRP